MDQKLNSLIDIRTGFQFRKKVKPDDQGDVDVIQIKDIDDRWKIDTHNLTRVKLDKPDRYFVKTGDVLFLARGHRMYGAVVPDLERNTIVSSYFFVLRPKSDKVLPDYLAWILNDPRFQGRLGSLRRGMGMPLLSKTDFAELSVDVPDLPTQHQIVRLNELMLKEARLLDQLKSKRASLIREISRKLLSGSLKTKDQ